jgi:TonB family protein
MTVRKTLVFATILLSSTLEAHPLLNLLDDSPNQLMKPSFGYLTHHGSLFDYTQHLLNNNGIDIKPADSFQLMANVDAVFNVTDEPASFDGGYWELQKFINQYYHKPTIETNPDISGKIYVRFVVTKEGEIKNVELVKGIHPSFDKEAMDLVRNMPRWIPAKIRSNNVASFITIPIMVY